MANRLAGIVSLLFEFVFTEEQNFTLHFPAVSEKRVPTGRGTFAFCRPRIVPLDASQQNCRYQQRTTQLDFESTKMPKLKEITDELSAHCPDNPEVVRSHRD